MTVHLALLAAGCVATTNVASAGEDIKRACGPHLKSVSLVDTALPHEGPSIEPDIIAYELTAAVDALGLDMGTELNGVGESARQTAAALHRILATLFPGRRIAVSFRDGAERPLCLFLYAADGEMEEGRCQRGVR